MSEPIKLILSLSLSGTILSLLLFVLKPLIQAKVTKTFLYYLWLVVLVRFICPFSLGIGLTDHLFDSVSVSAVVSETTYSSSTQAVSDQTSSSAEQADNGTAVVKSDGRADVPFLPNANTIALTVWAVGAVIAFFWRFLSYRRFLSQVRKKQYASSEDEATVLSALTSRSVALVHSPYIHTPMLIGFRRPAIVLPDSHYSPLQLKNILTHELSHLKRLDILYKWFCMVVSCIHWFNPILPVISSELNRLCELACDERVIAAFDDAEKQTYGNILLHMAYAGHSIKRGNPVSMFAEKKYLKERLALIMYFKKKSKRMITLMCVVAILVLASSVMLGAASINSPINCADSSQITASKESTTTTAAVTAETEAVTAKSTEEAASVSGTGKTNTATNTSVTATAAGNSTKPSVSASDKSTVPPIVLSYPLHQFTVSMRYGWIQWNQFHKGIDLKADSGAPVYAAAAGTVVEVEQGYNGGYGKTVILKHGSGDTAIYTLYAHLSEITVTKGQVVEAQRQIGTVGMTGVASGPHLHFEVRKADSVVVDLDNYLNFPDHFDSK